MRLLALSALLLTLALPAQQKGVRYSVTYKQTVFSENKKFFLVTTSFTNNGEFNYGQTEIRRADTRMLQYVIPHYTGWGGQEEAKEIILSNDGNRVAWIDNEVIFHRDSMNPVISIATNTNGVITEQHLSAADLHLPLHHGWSPMVFRSFIVNEKSKVVPKPDSIPQYAFYKEHCFFAKGDSLYFVTEQEELLVIDFRSGRYISHRPAISIFDNPAFPVASPQSQTERIDPPSAYDLPHLANGQATLNALGKAIGMKPLDVDKNEKYQQHVVEVHGILDSSGTFTVLSLDCDTTIPEEKVRAFFRENKFDAGYLQRKVPAWYTGDILFFRLSSKAKSKKERDRYRAIAQEQQRRNLTADSINHVYIPVDMTDCFRQLDKLLDQEDRDAMAAKDSATDMIAYHFGLGMWMRNNWGLWGGSRLQQYMIKRGILHPDSMSAEILEQYWYWLHGDKEAGVRWEKEHPVKQ